MNHAFFQMNPFFTELITALHTAPKGSPGGHLTNAQLIAISDGTLTPEAKAACDHHLDHCAECSLILLRLLDADHTEHIQNAPPQPLPAGVRPPHLSSILAAAQLKSSPQRTALAPIHPFFARLSDWINDLFSSLLPLQLANADAPAEIVEHKFDASITDPFRARLVRNTAGEWCLRVFTSDAEAAKLRLRLGIEEDPPVLAFVAGLSGHYTAEVPISDKMARDLQSGHRPVFHPIEPTS